MRNKTAIITGVTGNLGKAVLELFTESDYNVAAAIRSGQRIDLNKNSIPFEVDLMDEQSVDGFVQAVAKKFNSVDTAVLTVGGFAMGNIFNSGKNELDKMYKLNFETVYFMARAVFKKMIDQNKGGRMVFIASGPALDPASGKEMLAYTLSKSLVVNLAKILNAEGRDKNIVTSVVVPGIIDTPQNRTAMPEADTKTWVTPEAIAKTIAFACSADAADLHDPLFKVFGNA